MASQNHRGQILIEVCLVMFFVALAGFAAINELSKLKNSQKKYHLTEDKNHAAKNSYRSKK
ncbi:hypothetical protein [Bdellovibrio bacteriovorus]|uniref:hypothetical protein n=1 Tax=Bdellovibrio TaxID=958 RepID=UPI0035A97980